MVVFVLLLAQGLESLRVRQHLHDLQLSVDAGDVQSCVVVVTLEGIYLRTRLYKAASNLLVAAVHSDD